MKKIALLLCAAAVAATTAFAQTPQPPAAGKPVAPVSALPPKAAIASRTVDPIVLSNQMMITFMERMKNGDLPEAKKIAMDMIFGHEKLVDTPTQEQRSFSSAMEKRLYETFVAQEGRKISVHWVQQPIADGFYFLAMLEFQDKKVDSALDFLQKAIQWNPVHSAFYVERGYMYLHKAGAPDLMQAMMAYTRALELADNYVDFAAALRGIGFVLVEKGDMEGALACYLRSRLYDPRDKAAESQIQFLKSQFPQLGKDLDGNNAVGLLTKRRIPAGINPVHVKVLLSLADELGVEKKTKELKAILKQALILDPNNEMAKKKLATVK
jgi:tetratricopeptide (TPR) repeat protein